MIVPYHVYDTIGVKEESRQHILSEMTARNLQLACIVITNLKFNYVIDVM